MTWVQPLHTFVCGACGSRVTALYTLAALEKVMRVHAELCPGFPPPTNLPAATSTVTPGASQVEQEQPGAADTILEERRVRGEMPPRSFSDAWTP